MDKKPIPMKNRTSTMRIAQINAKNSRAVMDELRQTAHNSKIDIIMIQEPYTIPNSANQHTMGVSTKIVTDRKKFNDNKTTKEIWSAVAILNSNYTILKLTEFSNTHFTCIEATYNKVKTYIVNAYFQYSEKIDKYIEHLHKFLTTMKGKRILIALDSNAKSTLWHNNSTDDRGRKLEELIAQHDLAIVNSPSNLTTFSNHKGNSNIDLTLASKQLARQITNWKVEDTITTSDHNLITFRVNSRMDKPTTKTVNRFNINKADWDKFEQVITERENTAQSDEPSLPNQADSLANNLTDTLTAASNEAIPRKTRFSKSVPWWNKELNDIKKKVRRLRRRLQNATSPTQKQAILDEYRPLRNRYTAKIRSSKLQSWRSFVTEHGNKDTWGLVYRLQMTKLNTEQACNTIKINGQHTATWEETASALLHAIIPDDSPQENTIEQDNICTSARAPPDTDNTPIFTREEIGKAISTIKPKKTPGHDYLEAEIIRHAWPIMKDKFMDTYNTCLNTGVFPEIWKKGVVRLLLKSKEKNPSDPGSYRPICLLPILGKILEKLIASRIHRLFEAHPSASDSQFGFRPGRSTEQALVKARNIIENMRERYVVALFFDISGAFDNVWWPAILKCLKERDCPRNIFTLVESYLTNRTVEIHQNDLKVTKRVTKGCPQGSILGPKLWNLLFDDLLNKIQAANRACVAYADDLMVPIPGNSRRELEVEGNRITRVIEEWCHGYKLTLSQSKSEMLLVKGFLDIKRPPTIRIGSGTIRMKKEVKYLGVAFGPRLNVTPHINAITTKAKNTFHSLARIASKNWGLNYQTLSTLYKCIFIPVITYAAAAWQDKANTHHIRKLIQAQRLALLKVAKAYRTVSTEALQVITGQIPIDLKILERGATFQIRNGIQVDIPGWNFKFNPSQNNSELEIATAIEDVKERSMDLWQRNWDSSQKGRITHEFLPDVRERITAIHIKPDHHTTQLLTGHGRFKHRLSALGLSETDRCSCGGLDTPKHVLLECRRLNVARTELANSLTPLKPSWPSEPSCLVSSRNFSKFKKFAKTAMDGR